MTPKSLPELHHRRRPPPLGRRNSIVRPRYTCRRCHSFRLAAVCWPGMAIDTVVAGATAGCHLSSPASDCLPLASPPFVNQKSPSMLPWPEPSPTTPKSLAIINLSSPPFGHFPPNCCLSVVHHHSHLSRHPSTSRSRPARPPELPWLALDGDLFSRSCTCSRVD